MLKSLSHFILVCFSLLSICIIPARAQKTLWEQTKQTGKSGKEKVGKTTSDIKKLKSHIQEWGLDSSYTHAVGLGIKLNTNGWTGLANYQKRTESGKLHFYQLSFSEIKHEKQIKQQGENKAFPELGRPTPFVFGKINNLYLLQLGYGREQLLLPAVLNGNLSVSLRYQAGFTLAMLKPYYLRLIYTEYTPDLVGHLKEEKYSTGNADIFLDREHILGASEWKKSLNEITYVPGAFIEAAMALESNKHKMLTQTIVLGSQFSIHTKKLPIMAERKAYPWQACLFIGLNIGKRWK